MVGCGAAGGHICGRRLRLRRRLRQELTNVFAASYALGSIVAVLAVRQSGIFTAVIQPPLILLVAVPTSYFLFHGAHFAGIKDTLINFGYPLIERFPLMFFTSAAVLLIGLIRWYLGRFASRLRRKPPMPPTLPARADGSDWSRRLTAMFNREPADDEPSTRRPGRGRAEPTPSSVPRDPPRPTHDEPASVRRRRGPDGNGHHWTVGPRWRTGSDPARERARRRRPTREFDAPEPPRRSRLPRDPDLRGRPPRDVRRDPHARRDRPASRFDPYEPMEPFDAAPAAPAAAQARTERGHRDPSPDLTGQVPQGEPEAMSRSTTAPRRPRRPAGRFLGLRR